MTTLDWDFICKVFDQVPDTNGCTEERIWEVASELGVHGHNKNDLFSVLDDYVKEGKIIFDEETKLYSREEEEKESDNKKRKRKSEEDLPDSKRIKIDGYLLPKGWRHEEIERQNGKTAGRVDHYWYSPEGKKFRSKVQIMRSLGVKDKLEKAPKKKKQPIRSTSRKSTSTEKTKGKELEVYAEYITNPSEWIKQELDLVWGKIKPGTPLARAKFSDTSSEDDSESTEHSADSS